METKVVASGASGDIYHVSDVSLADVEDQRAYITRLKEDNTPVWEKVYEYRATSDIMAVAPNEKNVTFIL